MVIHNEEPYLEEAITSILSQSYGDFEFLILDDASTDHSADIAKEFAAQDPRIVHLANEHRLGLTKSLNRLIRQADGELIARMDGDDVSLPGRLERQVSKLTQEVLDLVWCNAVYIDDLGRRICTRRQAPLEVTLSSLPHPNHVVHAGSIYRKSSVVAVGGYDERYASGQDGDLWRRMRDAGFRFGVIHDPLLQARIRRMSVTGRRLSYPQDMSEVYTKICLVNGDREQAKRFLREVKSPFRHLVLSVRLLLGEPFVNRLKRLRDYSYDQVHMGD